MIVAWQSFYHRPGGKAVLRELVEYFYDYMKSLTELKSVREKHAVNLRRVIKHKQGLLKS